MPFSMMRLSTLMHIPRANGHSMDESLMQQVFERFHVNRMVVNHIQQLIHLLADFQRHRASSLAILSGSASFDSIAVSLERKISARLAYLDQQMETMDVIDQNAWHKILAEWRVVGYGWRQDSVQHNFELHSHLVEKTLNMVRDAGRWVLRSGGYSEEAANHYLHHAIFEFVFNTHLYQTETLGRLRGLGTHIASSGCSDNGIRMRVEFLLQCARQEQVVAREFLDKHASAFGRHIPAMMDMQRSEATFNEWLLLISSILEGKAVTSDDLVQQVFQQATSVIDARLALTEQVLAYLQLAMEEMLESLLEETAQQLV